MSAALNARPDTSVQSLPDSEFSLPSYPSGFSTPGHNLRIPSTSSQTTGTSSAPLLTPSPPNGPLTFSRRRGNEATPISKRFALSGHDLEGEEMDGDVLDTPGRGKRWAQATETPARARSALGGAKNGVLTLRDQEKHIDNLKKENFSIKLKVHFLEERLAQLAPDHIEAALKQNINLKIEVQQRGIEMKKLRKLVLELERELERLQRGSGGASARARELEEKLEEREREIRELRRRRAVGPDDGALRDVEGRNAELEEKLETMGAMLEQTTDELERLRELVERREEDDGESHWRQQAEELEGENEQLRDKFDALEELVTQRNDEKEELAVEVEALQLQLEDLRRRREAESIERSESRAQIREEREEREAVEEDLNAVRDKLAAAQIELQQKEYDLEMKNQEHEDLVAEYSREVDRIDSDWRGEVEEARGQVEKLKDALEQRETEVKELRMQIDECEAHLADMNHKVETALEHVARESEEKDAEIEAANREIERLGEQVYMFEDENERLRDESERIRDEEAVEREHLEGLCTKLKEKSASYEAQLEELNDLYESRLQEISTYRSRSEELAQHIENVVEELQRERTAREGAEGDIDRAVKEHDAALRREQRVLEAKESALQSALNDLARVQSLLSQREEDLQAVQTALQTLEAESKKLGETHTTARFSMQLEVDRLHRDVVRLEDELARARKELDDREGKNRDRDGVIDKLHAENRDLASQLAAQTQARMNISEKLDDVQSVLRTTEAELAGFRTKVSELEQRLAKDQRSLISSEAQYRDQLTERNTLLLTIYQYMDKILGVDRTPKKNGQAETKPFTNFSVFHDNLITRLKALSQIQLDFDRRCKDVEGRYSEKLNEMRKQLDFRWKQIDKFEGSVKTLAEAKAAWRKKLSAKEGELEALKATNTELQQQLVVTKKPGPGLSDSMEIRAFSARVANAERRAINLQNQLQQAEEKITSMNQKTAVADGKWEARVKEYETRLRAAEEKVKRERQGGKERALELENQARSYQRQIEIAMKRVQQLNDIIEAAGIGKGSSPSR